MLALCYNERIRGLTIVIGMMPLLLFDIVLAVLLLVWWLVL